MKHKFLTVLFAIIAALCLCFGLAACGEEPPQEPSDTAQTQTGEENNQGGGSNQDSENNEQGDDSSDDQGGDDSSDDQGGEQSEDTKNLISFKTLQIGSGNIAYGKVSNATEGFSFADEITVTSGATYVVYTDLTQPQEVENKTAPLTVGDNTFYIFASRGSGFKIYTVTLRRRPVYTVNFATSGSAVSSQQVEEDGTIAAPAATTRTGYTFRGWKLNGADATFPCKAEAGIPHTENYTVTFYAAFTANQYKVTFDAKGGEVVGNEQTVTYDQRYDFPVPTRRGYTFEGWYAGETQLTNEWGWSNSAWNIAENKSAEAHWTFNKMLYVTKNIDSAGAVSGGGNYDFGDEVTVTATTYLGYTFLGWYDDEDVRRSTDETFTYSRGVEARLIARWELDPALENLNFTSDEETCVITGVKNQDISQVTIPDYVTEIGRYAFSGCDGLKSVTIGSGVKSIGLYAFEYCDGLTSVTIGSGVTSIGGGAFGYCYKLIEVWNYSQLKFIEGTTSSGEIAYYAKHVYTENTPSKQKVVDDYLFYEDGDEVYLLGYLREDTELTLPTSSPSGKKYAIYQYAFNGRYELTSVTIGEGVTSIGDEAFYGCSGLTSVTIGSSVASIGGGAFGNCRGLESVTIGSGVSTIGMWAFASCDGLTSVTFVNPNGWGAGETEFPSEDLQNKLTAAQYLRDLYCGSTWTRK